MYFVVNGIQVPILKEDYTHESEDIMYEGVENKNMDARHHDKEDPPIHNNGSANVIYKKG
jgi:hypothetical protein